MWQATPTDDIDREIAAMKPVGRGRVVARILGAIALVLLAAAQLLFVAANGVTASTLTLGALSVAICLTTMVRPPPDGARRVAWITTTALCLMGVSTFVVVRFRAVPPPQEFRFVDEGRRDASPPWLSRLADERETVLAGLYFSESLGFVKGRERDHLDQLLRNAYSESSRPWPNAVLVESSSHALRHLEHVPSSGTAVPCIVFLHGFGGQLTAYLRVLHQAFGDRFVIVAPFLDYTGAFWTPRGKSVVSALVTKHLPAEVDRARIFLIGLSNGAVGATAILQDPELAQQFRGFVLVSGIGEVVQPNLGANVLLIAGTKDTRFPLDDIQRTTETLRGSGVHVKIETFPADHFLWLSHAREMTTTIDGWLSPQLQEQE
ncbi:MULTISPECIES: alpha/beta hydrolase family protein [Sorangium]|uniref:Uncharacterized protein n=1 Tax=Sorangium cellulosum (strain So ce56) TaxID=448385 RepID=A9F1B5_SORC5|nr:alpha/beta hydrolase [Sorangium cellulosum]CAN91349.1 hypothetical protein predicted by Glimmer/Critica [Sorangium cellulosum So ce56]